MIISKLIRLCQIIKTVFGDYSFNNFKIVKTIICYYDFKYKVKFVIDDYDLIFLK